MQQWKQISAKKPESLATRFSARTHDLNPFRIESGRVRLLDNFCFEIRLRV